MDNTFSLFKGQVVRSKKGRDEGEIFIILDIIDDKYVYLVDGKLRKLCKPKRKKVKHLYIYKAVVELDVENFNDAYIRRVLLSYS